MEGGKDMSEPCDLCGKKVGFFSSHYLDNGITCLDCWKKACENASKLGFEINRPKFFSKVDCRHLIDNDIYAKELLVNKVKNRNEEKVKKQNLAEQNSEVKEAFEPSRYGENQKKECIICGSSSNIYFTSDKKALCEKCANCAYTIEKNVGFIREFEREGTVKLFNSEYFLTHMKEVAHIGRFSFNFTDGVVLDNLALTKENRTYLFSEIIKVESEGRTYEVRKGHKGSVLGRAVIGGIVAGPIGAVIGGATAKDTRKIETKDTGMTDLIVYINKNEKMKELLYPFSNKERVIRIATENAFMKAVQQTETQFQNDGNNLQYDFDQLYKLKGLLDAGIISQEEFELKKKEILRM